MRSWIWAGFLATASFLGVYLILSGQQSLSHCGPCVSQVSPPAEQPSTCCAPQPEASEPVAVVEVFDLKAALRQPQEPKQLPFISFDEPPLAKPVVPAAPTPDIIQTAFTEAVPNNVEQAPMPRRYISPGSPLMLFSPNDPF